MGSMAWRTAVLALALIVVSTLNACSSSPAGCDARSCPGDGAAEDAGDERQTDTPGEGGAAGLSGDAGGAGGAGMVGSGGADAAAGLDGNDAPLGGDTNPDANRDADAAPKRCSALVDLGTVGQDVSSLAVGVNDLGWVVGASTTAGGQSYGFLYRDGSMRDLLPRSFGPSGAPVVTNGARAINNAGDVAGWVKDPTWNGGRTAAMVWPSVQGGHSPLTNNAIPEADARAIADAGQVIGWARVCFDQTVCLGGTRAHAFFWKTGAIQDLGTLGGVAPGSGVVIETEAKAVNATGQVVGWSLTPTLETHAFIWEAGTMRDLGTLGGKTSVALTITDDARVYGTSNNAAGEQHVFLWMAGVMTDLGALPAGTSVVRIGASGRVLGNRSGVTGMAALLWEAGTAQDLGTLGGNDTVAADMNDAGQVVGSSDTASGSHPFLWSQGKMQDLGTLGGTSGNATNISKAGKVAGNSLTAAGVYHAFLWSEVPCASPLDGGTADGSAADSPTGG
jgi:probable HAF family extracellular repeat protein